MTQHSENLMNHYDSQTFGQRLHSFYTTLQLDVELPHGIHVMNPYLRSETLECVQAFCTQYYADNAKRVSIWGINPGRFGGGLTGLSFTDPVVLRDICGIANPLGTKTELSAEYVWSVIAEFGGAARFFSNFFLTALCPLGFVQTRENREVNYNFYDSSTLFQAVKPFIVATMQQQLSLGIRRDIALCLGTGKLQQAFESINTEYGFFGQIIALEHPRFIMQYRRKYLHEYRQKYCEVLTKTITE